MNEAANIFGSHHMLIKVCGMRDPDNIRAVEATGPDWMGFICWEGSSRFVVQRPTYMPATDIRRVGVFVNPTLDDIRHWTQTLELDLIQLHGHETPDFCRKVKSALHCKIIKAFGIKKPHDLDATQVFGDNDTVDYFLFDTKTPLVGGSGQQYDWAVLEHYHGTKPFLLSGGIGPEDLARVCSLHHPQLIGIDLNSRFELEPALKDASLLHSFIQQLRS